MKMTLLQIVQNVLSAMDSDEVNSIVDTTESYQVALVVQETYFEQFATMHQPEFQSLIRLDGLSDTDSPNYLKVPDNVKDFDWVKYRNFRNDSVYRDVLYLPPSEFMDRVLEYKSTGDFLTQTTDPSSGVQYYIKNNISPQYYTLFDNYYIAFDSYDLLHEDTLHESASLAFGTKIQEFTLTDSFVPVIPDNLFPLLLAEAKSVCFINFKQSANSKEEQKSKRQRIRLQAERYKSKQQERGSIGLYDFTRARGSSRRNIFGRQR